MIFVHNVVENRLQHLLTRQIHSEVGATQPVGSGVAGIGNGCDFSGLPAGSAALMHGAFSVERWSVPV